MILDSFEACGPRVPRSVAISGTHNESLFRQTEWLNNVLLPTVNLAMLPSASGWDAAPRLDQLWKESPTPTPTHR